MTGGHHDRLRGIIDGELVEAAFRAVLRRAAPRDSVLKALQRQAKFLRLSQSTGGVHRDNQPGTGYAEVIPGLASSFER